MLRTRLDVMWVAARKDDWDAKLRGVFGERVSLLAAHQAIDQGEVDRLARKKEPRLFRRRRAGQSMAEGNEKLRYD